MKKIIALLLAVMMVISMAACGNSAPAADPTEGAGAVETPTEGAQSAGNQLAGTYDIKVWVAENIKGLTEQQIADFNASNEMGIVINATVEAVGEGDAATAMTTDVEAGADLYCFAQD